MKINKLIAIGKILSIAISILGIIHDIATFTPLVNSGLGCLSPADFNAVIYMSLMCGTSLILSGVILYLLLKKVEEFYLLALPILLIGVFLALSGVMSVVYMFDNPFAWLSLILNLSLFLITINLKLKLK